MRKKNQIKSQFVTSDSHKRGSKKPSKSIANKSERIKSCALRARPYYVQIRAKSTRALG